MLSVYSHVLYWHDGRGLIKVGSLEIKLSGAPPAALPHMAEIDFRLVTDEDGVHPVYHPEIREYSYSAKRELTGSEVARLRDWLDEVAVEAQAVLHRLPPHV